MNKYRNNTKFRIWGMVVGLLLFTACTEDFFDIKPGDRITPDQHYNSILDADISLEGLEALMQDVGPNQVLIGMLRGDLADVTENADADMRALSRHSMGTNNKYTDPSGYYKIIVSANEALANIAQIMDKDKDFDEDVFIIYKGLFIGARAWAYLSLLKMYGEAAYIDDNMTSLPEGLNLNYLSQSELSNKLITEFDTLRSEDSLELWFDIDTRSKIVWGELYLLNEEYELAAEMLYQACNTVDNNTKAYKVDREYAEEAWMNIFINAANQRLEVMIGIPFSLDDNQVNPFVNWTSPIVDYYLKPTNQIIKLFESEQTLNWPDPGDTYRGKGVSYDIYMEEVPIINKYLMDNASFGSTDIILSRAADIHLLYAEALNRLGDHESALKILNLGYADNRGWRSNMGIRGRVALGEITIPEGTTDVTLFIEDMILQERAMELAFEGKRWFDLVRIAKRRNDPGFLASKVAAKFEDESLKGQVYNRLSNPDNWYLPFNK